MKLRKITSFILAFSLIVSVVGCSDKKPKTLKLSVPTNISATDEGLISWDSVTNATGYIITVNGNSFYTDTNSYQLVSTANDYEYSVKATADGYLSSDFSDSHTFTGKPPVIVVPKEASISITPSTSEIRSGKSLQLTANVSGLNAGDDTGVTWTISKGSSDVTVSSSGLLSAKETDGDKIIKVKAVSKAYPTLYAEKVMTIVGKPVLTQQMLDAIKTDVVAFEGYVGIDVYELALGQKAGLHSTYSTAIRTSMDGTNWYAEYENSNLGIIQGLYCKNNEGIASEVGLTFTNEEQYYPILDGKGSSVTWEDSGYYNNFKDVDLKVSDFKFNEETWRYKYKGSYKDFLQRVIASANPYDFTPLDLELIISDGEVLGIYSMAKDDYSIVDGYVCVQKLYAAIDTGKNVTVPQISKYKSFDEYEVGSDEYKYLKLLSDARDNMSKLTSYKLDFSNIQASYMSTGYSIEGFEEVITENDCYFNPYTVSYDAYGKEIHTFEKYASYGYHKVNNELYNSYYEDKPTSLVPGQTHETQLIASRSFASDFATAKPTFNFSEAIFTGIYYDEEDESTTYYVDSLMSQVATTFYFGVGNDIALYGIFATEGTSSEGTFTPYLTVNKDGYITNAGFYYEFSYLYGVVEITYSEFNTAELDTDVLTALSKMEIKNIPTSWNELTFVESASSDTTDDDKEVNAKTYLDDYFGVEDIVPFFGSVDCLGDTYGFGMQTYHVSSDGMTRLCLVLYYDVPLDIDYTITTSLETIDKFLISLGYTSNKGEYTKAGSPIVIEPVDNALDLLIYIWKAE